MTNEQAIKWLKYYIQNTPFQMEQYERAFEMAIKALSQVSEIEKNIIKYMKKYPNHVGNTDFWEGFYACRNVVLQLDDEEYSPKEQEPCDDAISREAVIKTLHDTIFQFFDVCGDDEETLMSDKDEFLLTINKAISNNIKALPSVTQKSKTGHWIKKEDDTCWWYACSECEQEPLKNRWNDDDKLSAFCPNCGAKMVEP